MEFDEWTTVSNSGMRQKTVKHVKQFPFRAPGVKKSRGNVLGVLRDRRGPLGEGFPKP